jgi:hypothetical protein
LAARLRAARDRIGKAGEAAAVGNNDLAVKPPRASRDSTRARRERAQPLDAHLVERGEPVAREAPTDLAQDKPARVTAQDQTVLPRGANVGPVQRVLAHDE